MRMRRRIKSQQHGFAISAGYLLAFLSMMLNVVVVLYFTSAGGSSSGTAAAAGGKEPILKSLQWHGGHSSNDVQNGSCYCNSDSFCMCSPSLAIDLVILSGSDHVWLVRRKDTNQLATMGGFIQVGETVESAVKREIKEEMGIDLVEPPLLFGVYSDPRRDNRRHTVSITYAVRLNENARPVAADDVKEVKRIPLQDIEKYSFFADHKTILTDFRSLLLLQGNPMAMNHQNKPVGDFADDIVRSVCQKVPWAATALP